MPFLAHGFAWDRHFHELWKNILSQGVGDRDGCHFREGCPRMLLRHARHRPEGGNVAESWEDSPPGRPRACVLRTLRMNSWGQVGEWVGTGQGHMSQGHSES